VLRWLVVCWIAAALAAGLAWAGEPPQASSGDGRWRVAAEGPVVAVYEHGVRVKTLAATARDGRSSPSAVTVIRAIPARRSFVIAFETLAEIWELSIDPLAAPVFDGLVHDYRQGEALAEPGYLGVRRTQLEQPLLELALDGSGAYVLGRGKADADGRGPLHLVQLDIRRTIGRFDIAGDPDLALAQSIQRDGDLLLQVPDRHGGLATWVDLRRARLLAPGGSPR
jgi:hypothetical protein